MCGILGALNTAVSEVKFSAALATMCHRGPDGHDVDVDLEGKDFRFGHHRLAIIDLDERAKQPMRSRDNTYSLTFNGEIYNYSELRDELEALGEQFRTSSDTEVLLYALVRWGEAVLSRLDGMFALAFTDHQSQTVLIARDQLGIKPIYYARLGAGWVFASEIKALLELGVPAKLRRDCLGEYLANLWVMEPDTLFEGIYKLPSATWMRIAANGATHSQLYWSPPKNLRPYASEQEALDALLPKLERAVQSQLVADVTVGAYVSGGVDSSIVASLAA